MCPAAQRTFRLLTSRNIASWLAWMPGSAPHCFLKISSKEAAKCCCNCKLQMMLHVCEDGLVAVICDSAQTVCEHELAYLVPSSQHVPTTCTKPHPVLSHVFLHQATITWWTQKSSSLCRSLLFCLPTIYYESTLYAKEYSYIGRYSLRKHTLWWILQDSRYTILVHTMFQVPEHDATEVMTIHIWQHNRSYVNRRYTSFCYTYDGVHHLSWDTVPPASNELHQKTSFSAVTGQCTASLKWDFLQVFQTFCHPRSAITEVRMYIICFCWCSSTISVHSVSYQLLCWMMLSCFHFWQNKEYTSLWCLVHQREHHRSMHAKHHAKLLSIPLRGMLVAVQMYKL